MYHLPQPNVTTDAHATAAHKQKHHNYTFTHKTILIVDDDEAQSMLLKSILKREGFKSVQVLNDSRQVLSFIRDKTPDLLLLDLNMPHVSGLQVMLSLQSIIEEDCFFPIMVLTADDRLKTRQSALACGATDFLTKPYDTLEVKLRVRNLLRMRTLHEQSRYHAEQLEQQVALRTQQLEAAHVEMLTRLAKVAEYRDDDSEEHIWRVARMSELLAHELGLPYAQAELLLRAARLHDVGKVAIPDEILFNTGGLSEREFDLVKTHTRVGAELLSGGQSPLMQVAEMIALTHHERWDGTGYPQGLIAEQIPIESRILAVADTFDALTHDRVHRKACPVEEAVEEILLQANKQFDPSVVAAFHRLYERGELLV